MKFFSLLVVAVSMFGISCERHEFEGANGTKQLNQPHGGAGAHDEHAAGAAHEEKPAAHGEAKEH